MEKIGFAITSSFCTIQKIIKEIYNLKNLGYDVVPIASPAVIYENTRFGKGEEFKKLIEEITGREIVTTIIEAEKFGPKEKLDALIVAPATGNFIAKFASGITDNPVTMSAKATLRNENPIIIGVSTNDALGMNAKNIATLLNTKNIYFIPFGQDDYENKPNSLISHYELLVSTLEEALENKQIQPLLKEYKLTKESK